MNTLRTDGCSISFTCASRTQAAQEKLPDLELEDFSSDGLVEDFHLWAADPGVTQPFVAVDGHGSQPHQVRQFSAKEYYHVAGYDLTQAKLSVWKKNAKIGELETKIPSAATAQSNVFDEHVKGLLDRFDALTKFYDKEVINLRFLNYIGRQRVDDELVRVLINGGSKYAGRMSRNKKKKTQEGQVEDTRWRRPRKKKDQVDDKVLPTANGTKKR